MPVSDLKAKLNERELSTAGSREALIARLRTDDDPEPFVVPGPISRA